MSKKIAIITPTFPPYAGGIGNVAAATGEALKTLGYDVTVFTPLYNQVKEEVTGVKVVRIKPLLKYGNAAVVTKLPKLIKSFDIIHLHYPFFGGAEMLWLNRRKIKQRGQKIIIHYHMDVVGEGIFKIIFSFHRTFILPQIVKMADKIIFTSIDYGKESNLALAYQSWPDKFIEIPNGVDSTVFKPFEKSTELMARYNIENHDRIVLFVGGLDKAHYFKGVEYLIEAVARLRRADFPIKLVIVGEGELKKQYQDIAVQLNIGNWVVFSGYVPNHELPLFYNLADVVILASVDRSEAFGLTLVEGMSCAKPVIASDLGGVRSVIDNEVNGLLVKPKDVDDLAKKINFLLDNPDVARIYGEAGRTKVARVYDWKIIAKQISELYESL
ncbi:MAG: glycosyltransferase family 4 protein [Patescibacteria group bacterium]|nr:glycosyltransferase family 4 protein [Patescibacteria group bacterium]